MTDYLESFVIPHLLDIVEKNKNDIDEYQTKYKYSVDRIKTLVEQKINLNLLSIFLSK